MLESAASADTIEQWQLRLKKLGVDASWQFDKDLWGYLHESVDQPLNLARADDHGIW